MLALAFSVMLASSGLNDPGIGSPGLDSRTPDGTPQTSEAITGPQEATLPQDRADPSSRALGRVQ